jgi:hypothetical protein
MPTALRNVRFRGQSRKLLLALSFSGFDPQATSVLRFVIPASPANPAMGR